MIRVATIKDASRLAEIQIFSKRKAFRPIFQNDDVSFNEMSVLRLALYYQDVIGALDDIYVFDDGIVKGMMKLDCKKQYMGIERVVCRSVLSRRRCWDKTYAPFPYNSKKSRCKRGLPVGVGRKFCSKKIL